MKYTIKLSHGKGYIIPLPEIKISNILNRELSYKMKGYEFVNNKSWDGIVRLYNNKYGSFNVGLLERVKNILLKIGNEIIIQDLRAPTLKITLPNKLIGIELREYQKDAVDIILKNKIGLVNIPVGGGKTEVALEIIRSVGLTTLILCHTKEIFNQWIKRIGERLGNISIGEISAGKFNIRDVTVGMFQTISRKLNTNKTIEVYLNNVGCLVLDECHHIPASTFKKVLRYVGNAKYRIGLTGTAFREDGRDMDIEAGVGKILYTITPSELMRNGYLAKTKVIFVNLPPKIYSIPSNIYKDIYDRYIINNFDRNKKIVEVVKNEIKRGLVLILVDRIKHGEILYDDISKLNIKVMFMNAKLKKEERKKIVDMINEKSIDVVIGTQLFQEGVDFPNLHTLVLANGGKSAIKVIQQMGRVLRIFKGKEEARIYDFKDDVKYLSSHYKRRRVIFEKEEEIEIVD